MSQVNQLGAPSSAMLVEGRKHDEQPRTSKSESAADKETERTKQHRIRMEDQSDQNDQNDRPNDEEEFEDQNDQNDDEEEFKVCQGLTDEERRKIRKEQRLLRSNIPDLDVDEARKRNNKIFKNVRYVRESVLDAENINDIVKKAGIKIEQMIKVSCSSCIVPAFVIVEFFKKEKSPHSLLSPVTSLLCRVMN